MAVLLTFTGVTLIMTRSEVGDVKAALQRAESQVKETDLRLQDALNDKQQVIKELGAQGNRLAEFSRDEEKARSALTAVSTGAEATQKSLAKLRAQLRALRKENAELRTLKAEMVLLTGELDETRLRLEQAEAKLQQLRAAAEPYSAGPGRPRQ
jgi:predicted RNase H-like nuclease (RuvC/YqgF family)